MLLYLFKGQHLGLLSVKFYMCKQQRYGRLNNLASFFKWNGHIYDEQVSDCHIMCSGCSVVWHERPTSPRIHLQQMMTFFCPQLLLELWVRHQRLTRYNIVQPTCCHERGNIPDGPAPKGFWRLGYSFYVPGRPSRMRAAEAGWRDFLWPLETWKYKNFNFTLHKYHHTFSP